MERSTVMFKFLVCLLLVSTGLAAPAPAADTTTDNSKTLEKSLPGIIANVKATEVLQPNKASEGLAKSTPGIILESSSADKTQIHTSDNKTEECANDTLSATDKSDKIIDQKDPEDKTKININSETSIKSEINVKDSHKDVTGQTPLSHNDSSVSEELDSSRRKAKVLDSGRLGTESESASVQLQPGHDAPTASQGRVESLSSHVQRNSANQHLESHKSPLDKNSAINKEDDKIQSPVSANNILTKEKQEKEEDIKAGVIRKTEGRAINTSDKNILIENINVSSASEKHSDPSITVKNVEVGITAGPINKIGSLQSELDRGLIALNVFQKLSELLDLNAISTNNTVVTDGKLISKDKNTVSSQPTSPLKNIDDQKIENTSSSRGSLKFEKNDSSFSDGSEIDISKNSEIDKITQSATQAKVNTPSTLPKIVDTKDITPSALVKIVETKVTTPLIPKQIAETKLTTPSTFLKTIDITVTTPSSLVQTVETKVTIPSAEVKSKVTTPTIENITKKIKLIKELDSSTTSVSNFGTTKTYQDSSNFRHPSNLVQNKHFENQSINIQAKPLEDNVSTHLDESTMNPVTPQRGHGQVTQTPAPTVQWIKITPPANQTPAAKINNDENLEVQEANYLSKAAKDQFQSNNNYPYNSNTRVPKINTGAEKSLEESKFVKIIPTSNQGIISAIPKISQTFESSSEPQSYSSPKYIAYDNTPKSINDKESFSTPGPFSYSTVNNIDNNYYSRNPTPSPVENNRQTTAVLNQANDSLADPQINTNINTGRYENQRSRNTPTVAKIFSSSDNGNNIAQSRDAYKNLQEISLDTPKDRQTHKDKIDVVVQTVSDGYKNAIRRVNPNVARNNNSFENVSPSNIPYIRGDNKYKSNRFDTISAFTTDSQINKLYTQSSPTTRSQYNPVTQRTRNRVTSSTTVSSSLKEEKNILDKRNEEKLVAAQKASDTKETPKGKYAVRTSRGNIKYVKNPHSGDWLGDGDDKYPPQFSYNYKTATGISAYQKGVLTEINDRKVFVIHGSYNYTAPDGTPVIMTYTADEFGFHPQQTVSDVVKNKLEPTKSKDFDKELGKRRAKMVRKAQHSERMNSTETENNNSEKESQGPVEPAEIAEETTKLANTVEKIARGRGRNIYREVNNNGDANNVREVRTVEAEKEIKTPQRITRRRNLNPTVPLESA